MIIADIPAVERRLDAQLHSKIALPTSLWPKSLAQRRQRNVHKMGYSAGGSWSGSAVLVALGDIRNNRPDLMERATVVAGGARAGRAAATHGAAAYVLA